MALIFDGFRKDFASADHVIKKKMLKYTHLYTPPHTDWEWEMPFEAVIYNKK